MRWLFSFLVFFFQLSVFAQQADSIPNHEDSIRQEVSQNRRLLLDKFRAGRLDSVALLVDSIDHQRSGEPLLWPAERLLLYYWIERYHVIDSVTRYFDVICKTPGVQSSTRTGGLECAFVLFFGKFGYADFLDRPYRMQQRVV